MVLLFFTAHTQQKNRRCSFEVMSYAGNMGPRRPRVAKTNHEKFAHQENSPKFYSCTYAHSPIREKKKCFVLHTSPTEADLELYGTNLT